MFQQRDNIDTILFEDGTLTDIERVQRQTEQLFLYRSVGARKEARPHPVGDAAEALVRGMSGGRVECRL